MSKLKQEPVETFYDSSQLESKGVRVDGKLDGLHGEFYLDGKLKHRHSYKLNIKNGLHEDFYGNGQLKERINYINGERDGFREWFDEYGQLETRESFKGEILMRTER